MCTSVREHGEPADLGPRLQPPAINRIPSQPSADAGLACTPPRDGGSAKLDVQGTRRGAVSRASGRRGTGLSEKFLFDKSWLSMLPSLRGNGGHGHHPNLPEVLWRTLCMDMPYGSQFDPEAYGSHIPAEFAGQFRVFMLLVIFPEADRLILKHLSMPVSIKNTTTFRSTPHDLMSAELGPVLENMEAITSHDGGSCCLPSRQDIVHYWHDFEVLAGSKREWYCRWAE
ncbi:Ankyrin and HET domain protein, partial [Metarhizium majus ARSEF 297]